MGILFALAVIACIVALAYVGISYAIDQGHKAYQDYQTANEKNALSSVVKKKKKRFIVADHQIPDAVPDVQPPIKPQKDIKADVDWAKMVNETIKAQKPKPPKTQKFNKGLPPGARKLNTKAGANEDFGPDF